MKPKTSYLCNPAEEHQDKPLFTSVPISVARHLLRSSVEAWALEGCCAFVFGGTDITPLGTLTMLSRDGTVHPSNTVVLD